MSLFDNLPTIEEIGGYTETVSTGSSKLPTDFYKATIKQAYGYKTDAGAGMFNIDLTINNKDYSFPICITSGDLKGNKPTYMYNQILQILVFALKKQNITFKDLKKKPITIKDKQDSTKTVESYPELEGKEVGVLIAEVDNSSEEVNPTTGEVTVKNYTKNELRTVASITKKETLSEILNKSEAKVIPTFLEKNKDTVLPNKSKPAVSTAANKPSSLLPNVTPAATQDLDFG